IPASTSTSLITTWPHSTREYSVDVFSGRQHRRRMNVQKKERYHATPGGKAVARPESTKRQAHSAEDIKKAHFERINKFYNDNKHYVDNDNNNKVRREKTPMAMQFAYVGTGYHGLEYRMTEFVALENVLEQALFKAGMILPSNLGDPNRLRWNRSSRTDKGVHSLCTLLSASLEMDRSRLGTAEGLTKCLDEVNSHLPAQLRLMALVPTNKSFNPRQQCTSRTYHYMVPKKHLGTIYTMDQINKDVLSLFLGPNSYHNFTHHRRTYKDIKSSSSTKELPIEEDAEEDNTGEAEESATSTTTSSSSSPDAWKLKPMDREAEMEAFRLNSKNYKRILGIRVVDTMMRAGTSKEEWVTFEIEGDSFIQYQIRKMIGFTLAVLNGHCDRRVLEIALKSPFSMRSPVAPPTPLYLQRLCLGDRATMDTFCNNESINRIKTEFCHEQLQPHIVALDERDQFFQKFMDELLPSHFYSVENDDLDKLYNMYLQFDDRSSAWRNNHKSTDR
ncbi:hypothetical protein SAMD00019534_035140, partial [Acytostelium subglobosum LB1]|uniref:hypothetical protein n=1 Tax=Acytostelium subglobosum LB1 TaxID=1410327 RepID=UPI000644AC17